MLPQKQEIYSQIEWEFTVAEQGMFARYGRLGNRYYRQFLPYGVESPLHSPKEIAPRLYNLARMMLNRGG